MGQKGPEAGSPCANVDHFNLYSVDGMPVDVSGRFCKKWFLISSVCLDSLMVSEARRWEERSTNPSESWSMGMWDRDIAIPQVYCVELGSGLFRVRNDVCIVSTIIFGNSFFTPSMLRDRAI